MNRFILLSAFLFSAFLSFAGTPRKPAISVTSDSSYIYIYRVGQWSGALSNFAIFVDGKKLCKISNNKYFKIPVSPGKHVINAKVGGVDIFKKETTVEIEAANGGEYYVACNMKNSFTRVRLEMVEVTRSSGIKQMATLTEDKCQEKIDAGSE